MIELALSGDEFAQLITAFFAGLVSLATVAIPLYFREKNRRRESDQVAEALSEAVDEARDNGKKAHEILKKRTATDLDLKSKLDAVHDKTKVTRKLKKDGTA